MRIKAIKLSWFRGAAETVSLEPQCKSMVIYGLNGSGKSSFVDVVEYSIDGKIRHLIHEYSGKRQEKAIPNTHKPSGQETELSIELKDATEAKIVISEDGSSKSTGTAVDMIQDWAYQRTVLRQDEVAMFIHSTKGEKYSALLPLLGLHQLEIAAENLRQLAKSVEDQSNLKGLRVELKDVELKRKSVFGTKTDTQILKMINELFEKYCPEKAPIKDALLGCGELQTALASKIAASSTDQRLFISLQEIAGLDLKGHIDAVRSESMKLATVVEPLIIEKLKVLQSTSEFVGKLGDGEEKIKCPACGQHIPLNAFKAHVTAESEHLKEIIKMFEERKTSLGILIDVLKSLKLNANKVDIKQWLYEIEKGVLATDLKYLNSINIEALRASCNEEDLETIETNLLPLVEAATSASKEAPPDTQQLTADLQIIQAGKAVIAATERAVEIERVEALISFINALEHGVRTEIRVRSQQVIDDISADIQTMWSILHPDEAIENVNLYLPEDTDKAIDISLKFYGIEQESPRLTLSEGYRNSLGLCIFLAMAKREADKDRPLFLDDVVISLDREHRGMIVELLKKEFEGRQVVILTHDREWYTELRQQLDEKCWTFKALLPYESPDIGIRWSHKTTTFEDARAHLKDRPDSAANDARKIMDVELALAAEKLQVRLPYLRAEKNDRRTAHNFMERIIADGNKCFQIRSGKDYAVHTTALAALQKADQLLVSWGNRGSHTFDVVLAEATALIDACEEAYEFFKCTSCGKFLWFADAGSIESVQCNCGQIRWRYGKG